jgi:hypothetical protein
LFEASQGKEFTRPYLEKLFTKIGLVEWFKVKTMRSSPRLQKNVGNDSRIYLYKLYFLILALFSLIYFDISMKEV